jgi:hypothetical protein
MLPASLLTESMPPSCWNNSADDPMLLHPLKPTTSAAA